MAGFTLREVDNNLRGRLALVTGASGGIGAACARALAAEGCDVALHYSASSDAVDRLAEELRARHPSQSFVTQRANLLDRQEARLLVKAVLQSLQSSSNAPRAVSVLVANAGIGRRIRDVAGIAEQDWDEVAEINARSQFVVTKACVEGMREQGWGRVILVGSISAHGGGMNGCHYAASKGAITSMGLNLATVLAPDNITVNIVSPAMIGSTGMVPAARSRALAQSTGDKADPSASAQAMESDLASSDPGLAIASTIPLGRLGEPDEVANVVIMYAKTGYLTGQDILLSGGLK